MSEMKCGFVLLTACLFFVLRLQPPFSDSAVPQAEIVVELPGSSNILFSPYLVVDSQDFVSTTWIHRPFLRPVKLRQHPIAKSAISCEQVEKLRLAFFSSLSLQRSSLYPSQSAPLAERIREEFYLPRT